MDRVSSEDKIPKKLSKHSSLVLDVQKSSVRIDFRLSCKNTSVDSFHVIRLGFRSRVK